MKHPTQLRSIEIYDKTTSTMDKEPPALPGAVIALEQTQGRGRTGPWISTRGGAWLTLHTPQEPPPGLPVALGGCLATQLNRLLPNPRLYVKWPNDIVAVPGCHKVAGILVEHRGATTRIGVGVNVYNQPPSGAANLAQLGYRGTLGETIRETIKAILLALHDTPQCIEKARHLNILENTEATIETPNGVLTVTIRDITRYGALVAEAGGEKLTLTCCHIKHYTCRIT